MYNKYFGFDESPFENNLDQMFFFLSEDHREVLAALLYFVKAKKSFAIVCGDVGTGKSMLINCFLTRLPESVLPVMVSTPYVSSEDLLQTIAIALNIRTSGQERIPNLTDKVKQALIEAQRQQKQLVLVVDEAHLLSDQALEEIRLLSNLETPEQKLLQILLVGQYELSYKLNRPEMRHLRQRLNVNRFLSPLKSFEIIQYIDHRLKQVGSSFAAVFEPDCQKLLFKMTGGVPRSINQICDNALLICKAQGVRKVNPKILKKAERALQTDLIFTPKSARSTGVWRLGRFFSLRGVAAAVITILIIGMISFNSVFLLKNYHQIFSRTVEPSKTLIEAQTSLTAQPQGTEPPKLTKPEPTAPEEEPRAELQALQPPIAPPDVSSKEPETSPSPGPLKPQEGPPIKVGTTSETSGEPPSTETNVSGKSNQLTAGKGASLIHIAAQHYPENKKLGLEAIILANPKITNQNLIYQGQSLYLPTVNFHKGTIRLKDGLFYATYGSYQLPDGVKKGTSGLIKNQVRFQVKDTKDSAGRVIYRIFLGGYNTEEDLARTIESLR